MNGLNQSDRIIGKLEEFKEWSKDEFKSLHKELLTIRYEIQDLQKFRWIIYGKAAAIYSLIVMVVEFILHKTLFSG